MKSIEEVNLKSILPSNGPSIDEVKKYLEKYNDETIIIKCGGSVLIDPNLFNLFIQDVVVIKNLGLTPIILHGGGKRINNKLSELNVESTFIKRVKRKNWPLPKTMLNKIDFLRKLKNENKVDFKERFGIVICYTEVYEAILGG